jgi:hypothetical protein
MVEKIKPGDLIALLIIVAYVLLSWRGTDSTLNSAILIVVGFYFGVQHEKNNQTVV